MNTRVRFKVISRVKLVPQSSRTGRKRTEPRRKPRIQDVRILLPMLGINWWLYADIPAIGLGFVVPDRNLVTPPKLPADTPVADVLDPVLKTLDPALRSKPDLPGSDCGQGAFDLGIPEEPLFAESRLDGNTSPFAIADVVLIWVLPH